MPETQPAQEPILERLPLAICSCDAAGTITQYNRQARNLWKREPAPEQRFSAASRLYDSSGRPLPDSGSPVALVLSTGDAQRNREIILERPDGSRITVLSNVAPVFGVGGRISGAIDVFQDISDRKRSEEARRLAERLAASSRLAAAVAREIQSPLDSMSRLLELVRQDATLSAEARGYAEMAQLELSRLARIAHNALGMPATVA